MFSTVLKFNPKEDYEVDLSPDAINFADRYRPPKLDEKYRDRKRMNDQMPHSKVRLLSQVMVNSIPSNFAPAMIPLKNPLAKGPKDEQTSVSPKLKNLPTQSLLDFEMTNK